MKIQLKKSLTTIRKVKPSSSISYGNYLNVQTAIGVKPCSEAVNNSIEDYDLIEHVPISSQFKVEKLTLDGTELEEKLRDYLSRFIIRTLDPDLAGKKPDKFISNLKNGVLGDFSKRYIITAYDDNNKVFGILIGMPEEEQQLHIYSLHVSPEYRNKGVGSILLQRCINDMCKSNIKDIIIDVHMDNKPAYNLYKKFNFIEINKKKILVVFGTRPEATKMAMVIKELKKYPNWFETLIVVTGQHKEQLDQALAPFNIQPDINLDIMKVQQTPSYVTAAVIKELDDIIAKEKPDLILVHGDTQTTVSAALSACYNKIPVAHVEAGLRSFNQTSPWPEEINRCVTDSIASVFLAPTNLNRKNLLNQGANPKNIYVTGQTQIDSALSMYDPNYCFKETELKALDYNKKIILVTAHRRENYGEPMKNMFRAIRRIADEHPEVTVVYPVHLSPIVQETAKSILSNHERILLLNPIDYAEMINLMARAHLVMSDSGGLQEECPVFHKPLVLMRDTTERQEGIEANVTILCGTNENNIYEAAHNLLINEAKYYRMANAKNPFGDGKASERIVRAIAHYFGIVKEKSIEFIP